MILTPAEMRAAEERVFARGVSAEDLMERAGAGIAEEVRRFHPSPGTCVCAFGKGNNGGDALVAARLLARMGWAVVESAAEQTLTSLTARKLAALREARPVAPAGGALVVLDGLLGTGAAGAPRAAVVEAIRKILALRERHGAVVFAADIPSGLDGESGLPSDPCVVADHTVAVGYPKTGLLCDAATPFVGRLSVVALDGLDACGADTWEVSTAASLRLAPLPYERHKGEAGRVSILAGSPGYTGAARLCSAAAAKAGAGLVTLFVPRECAGALAAACSPEVMVRACGDLREALEVPADVLAIGPGLGRDRDTHCCEVIREFPGPAVVDADALNALAADVSLLRRAKGPRLLTPHPGEMERLFPQHGRTRRRWAEDFVASNGAVLLLKGARSIVLGPGMPGIYNATGNPGMASGGMGDVLTGVCAALLAAGLPPVKAGATGAWLCGRAAEIAVADSAPEALLASDVIDRLGRAFAELREPGSLPLPADATRSSAM